MEKSLEEISKIRIFRFSRTKFEDLLISSKLQKCIIHVCLKGFLRFFFYESMDIVLFYNLGWKNKNKVLCIFIEKNGS
jgi:hypothetical protein